MYYLQAACSDDCCGEWRHSGDRTISGNNNNKMYIIHPNSHWKPLFQLKDRSRCNLICKFLICLQKYKASAFGMSGSGISTGTGTPTVFGSICLTWIRGRIWKRSECGSGGSGGMIHWAFYRRMIRLIECNAKCLSGRNFAAGVLSLRQRPLLTHCIRVYSILIHTGKGGGGEELTREKVREAIVHKAGRKYQQTHCISSL